MTTRRTVLLLALLPALALAQEKEQPQPLLPPTGRVLIEAVPDQADLVLHTASLPALIESARELGDSAAWSQAFGQQLRAWGAFSGEQARLEQAGRKALDAMDGEALAFGLRVPVRGARKRAFVLAFRTSWRAKQLNPVLKAIVETGLREHYLGEPKVQAIYGRRVVALQGHHDRLLIHVQDGFVAMGDHPLALGLLFQKMAQNADREPNTEAGKLLLDVRYGRGEQQWVGSFYGDRETVSWTETAPAEGAPRDAPLALAGEPIVALAAGSAADHPLLPGGVPDWAAGGLPALPAPGPYCLAQFLDGTFQVSGRATGEGVPAELAAVAAPAAAGRFGDAWAVHAADRKSTAREPALTVRGVATRHGWFRALVTGRLPMPLPGVSRQFLLEPLATAVRVSAAEGEREAPPKLLTWTAPDRPGALGGPLWHGPATFLALRTLTALGHGLAPPRPSGGEGTTPADAADRARPKPRHAPLPQPTDARKEDAPPLPAEDGARDAGGGDAEGSDDGKGGEK